MLPRTFLYLLHVAITVAQSSPQQLSLGQLLSFSQSDAPPRLIIPTGSNLFVTIAICSQDAGQRFFLTNSSSAPPDIPGAGGNGAFEITLNQGLGVFKGPFPNGGLLVVDGSGAFEVGVSDTGMSVNSAKRRL